MGKSNLRNLEAIKDLLVDWLYPRRCPVCDEIVMPKGELICLDCIKKLSFVKEPSCKRCGKELISEQMEYCLDCTRHKKSFEYGKALINYDETARRSVTRIKYQNKREYLDFYGAALCGRYEKQIRRMDAELLVPVPVHPSRRRERGFNQAELLADRIGERMGLLVCKKALTRNKRTMPQKELNPAERLKNLEQAFEAGPIPEGIKGVILVDDIYTTGSTIEACTRALKRAGVRRVYFLTICIGQGL